MESDNLMKGFEQMLLQGQSKSVSQDKNDFESYMPSESKNDHLDQMSQTKVDEDRESEYKQDYDPLEEMKDINETLFRNDGLTDEGTRKKGRRPPEFEVYRIEIVKNL